MNQTLHIIRKDLRRLRWLLVAWVVIVLVSILVHAVQWMPSSNASYSLGS